MSLCIKQKLKFSPPLEKCLYILIGPLLYKYNIYKFIRRINWRLNPSIIRSDTNPFLTKGKKVQFLHFFGVFPYLHFVIKFKKGQKQSTLFF